MGLFEFVIKMWCWNTIHLQMCFKKLFQFRFQKADILLSAESMIDKSKIANNVKCFIYTFCKQIWIATTTNFLYKVGADQKIDSINIPSNYQIRCFAEDAMQHIWVGTDKGLFVFNKSG